MASEIMSTTEQNKPLFTDIQADDEDQEISVIESLCLQCKENGSTQLMLTKIPFYKEVVLMSFSCPHCGWKNCELQHVADIQEKAIRFKLKVTSPEDLNRQVVKSEWAVVSIPELEFEIPEKTQEGAVTTIEGVISRAITGLSQRLQDDVDGILVKFISKLHSLKEIETPFTFIMDDLTGNSFLQNLRFPKKDPHLDEAHYARTKAQDEHLGIFKKTLEDTRTELDVQGEVLEFATNCPSCNSISCYTNMKLTKIPHFKEVVIMATTCDSCGHRTNEVKSGSGIETLGTRITLNITGIKDMSRDLLKSETCSIKIPELEFEVGAAAITGRFTTVEGLLMSIKEQLAGKETFMWGDSSLPKAKSNMEIFLCKVKEITEGTRKVTLILDDPCGNSYLQSLEDNDPDIVYTHYERTFDQNEDLGLNDMKTENYEED